MSWRHEDHRPKRKDLQRHSLDKGRWGLRRETISGNHQSAYCDPIFGKKPEKLVSLAAIVAEQHQQPWMGLYQLDDDLYWYIAVRDGHSVIPDGDKIGTYAEVIGVHNRHLHELGEWDEQEGTLNDLAELVRGSTRNIKLQDLQGGGWGKALAIGGGIGVALIGGIAGVVYYQHGEEEKARVAAEQRRAVLSAIKARKDAESRILPWTRLAMPSDAFAACRDAWYSQRLSQMGWKLASWHCGVQPNAVTINATFDRDGGLADDAPGRMAADAQHSTVSQQIPVSFPAPSSLAETSDAASRAAWTLSQRYGIPLTLTAQQTVAPLPGSKQAEAEQAPWTSSPAIYTTRVAPWLWFAELFDAVPGMRVNTLDWTAAKGWEVNGSLYSLRGGMQAGQGKVGPQKLAPAAVVHKAADVQQIVAITPSTAQPVPAAVPPVTAVEPPAKKSDAPVGVQPSAPAVPAAQAKTASVSGVAPMPSAIAALSEMHPPKAPTEQPKAASPSKGESW
nr:type 4b pilus protein PilO2 [Burkholderia sp. Ac-20365]